MDTITFEKTVASVIAQLPSQFKDALNNIAITIEDEPTVDDYQAAHVHPSMDLFGLYQGVPLTKRASTLIQMPDRIKIFKGPIERVRGTDVAIHEQIRSTVLHEIGHYFGMSEEQLRNLHS